MTFKISPDTHIGLVALWVKDLPIMVDFYQNVIGLKLLTQTTLVATFSAQASTTPIFELRVLPNGRYDLHTTGLYHTAFVQPTRKDLGNSLLHYEATQTHMFLKTDHRYTESLYVRDPEHNAVEVYWDKPAVDWLVEADGRMPQQTTPLDEAGVRASADGQWQGIATGGRVGHIHLQIANLDTSVAFYQDILGLSEKDRNFMPNGTGAAFMAAGGYHHHVALNNWREQTAPMVPDQIGLHYFTIAVPDEGTWQTLLNHLTTVHQPLSVQDQQIWLTDPDQIQIHVTNE